MIIGIAGPTASGKSTLCKLLAERHPDIGVIKQDDFYKDVVEFESTGRWKNWEHHASISWEELIACLADLKAGKTTLIPSYSRRDHARRPDKVEFSPKETLILEGFQILITPEVRKFLDHKIYLDIPLDVQRERRFKRQPDLDPEYFDQVIVPSTEKIRSESLKFADLVLDGTQPIEKLLLEIEKFL